MPPIDAPLVPAPPTPVKATLEPLTAEARVQLVLTRRLLMRLADLQASLFFPMEPLTLLERHQVAMQRLAEREHTTVAELEKRFAEFATGSASASQAPPLDRALAAYVRQDHRSAASAAAEAARELSGDPDELRAALLLQAHALYFNQDSKGAIAIYEKVMKETTSTRQPAEWVLSTSMVAMLSSATKSEYKPAELMMKVLASEEYTHGKESYAVARTLRQIAHHLPTREDLNELRETALGRASKIHEKLDPERATPEVARIYIAFAKGRDSRLANDSSMRQPDAGRGSAKPRKTGFRNDAYYAGAIKIDERHFGLDSPAVADDLMEQGRDLTLARRFAEAEPPLRRALTIQNKQRGSRHQETINAQSHLGRLLRESGRFDEAEAIQLSALANQKECPEESDFCLGLRHYELALVYKAAGRAQAYEKTLRTGIAAAKGDEWPDVFPLHMMLEDIIQHLEENRRDLDAVPFIVRRIDIMVKIDQISPDEVALWLGKAAHTLSNASDEDPEVDLLFQRALKAGAKLPTSMAAVHVVNLRRYADYLIPLKRIKEAEKHLREAVTLDEQVPSHEEKGSTALLLGSVLMSHGDPNEAITYLKAALPMVIQRHGELHPDTLWGYYCLSTSYLMADRPKDAEPLLRKTLALMDKAGEKDPVVHASTVLAHGMSLMDLGRLDDAEPVLRRSVRLEYAAREEEGDGSGSETAANYYRDVLTMIYGLTDEEAQERILDVRTGRSVPKLEIRKPAKVPRPKLTA
jgi:tetratricopeptide (TPR) repeat protein